jgi:hypothetical protein
MWASAARPAVAGVFGTQIEDDELSGNPLSDRQALAFLLGPVVNSTCRSTHPR